MRNAQRLKRAASDGDASAARELLRYAMRADLAHLAQWVTQVSSDSLTDEWRGVHQRAVAVSSYLVAMRECTNDIPLPAQETTTPAGLR